MYQEADLQRISLPLRKQLDPPKEKLSDEETKKREQDAQDAMKKEAELIRARAAAGEDFDKLQQEVYTFAGLKLSPPSTKMMKVRQTSLPNDASAVFDLKTGEVSQVIAGPTGYLIYKVEGKDTIPFEKARPEIMAVLSKQRIQDLRQAILQSATTVLNDAYFPEPAAAARPAQSAPGKQATPKPPATGPK
jgi:parvulin-like peptidyl-prolyl isomerase